MLQSGDGIGHTGGVGTPSEHASNKTGSLCKVYEMALYSSLNLSETKF